MFYKEIGSGMGTECIDPKFLALSSNIKKDHLNCFQQVCVLVSKQLSQH